MRTDLGDVLTPPLAAMISNTDYFEVESSVVGGRFAVWVTRPPNYEAEPERSYPAIYMPDGNIAAPGLGPRNAMLRYDPIDPIEPFVQVCVGYCGDEAADNLRVRNRDLLPPGEPADPRLDAGVDDFVAKGMITPEVAAEYKRSLRDGHADKFLSFLVDELHPAIAERYRIDPSRSGLFGYSYGGLFATWVAMQRPALFSRIGAGSPGMMTADSVVFALLKSQIADGTDHTGRALHMTVCEREITEPSFYQSLGVTFAQFNAIIGANPLPGLRFTSRIVPDETHATGVLAAWSGFLRACYRAQA